MAVARRKIETMDQRFRVEREHLGEATAYFARKRIDHLRARVDRAYLVIESGPWVTPFRHARLQRLGAHIWTLDVAMPGGGWMPRGPNSLSRILECIATDPFIGARIC
jgi:hypothetical protein